MKFKRVNSALWCTATAAAVAVTALVGGSAAGASPFTTGYEFVGYGGGSLVRAADNSITSDLTAASSINNEGLVRQTNDAAHVFVKSLLNTGEVATSAASTAIPGGYQVRSEARTAGVSALGGAITADAIDTVSIAKVVDGVASTSVQTTFVNLTVGTVKVPANVPPNTIIRIPNVATVALNYQLAFTADGNKGYVIGIGAYVDLLKARGENAVGAQLAISPTTSQLGPVVTPPSGHFLYANAYGTKVEAHVGTLVGVHSDETAPITMPAAGTDPQGSVQTANIAGVNLSPVARVGAITDSVQGTNNANRYSGRAGSRVGAINLFNGAIKADAVGSFAQVSGPASATVPTVIGGSTLVNLIIGGKPINIDTSPNTVIKVGNLLQVTINQQIRPNNRAMIVRALDIKVLVAQGGFPAGAEIQVAVTRVNVS